MQNNNQKQIISTIVVVAFIIAGAILLKGSTPPAGNNELIIDNTTLPSSADRTLGKDDHIVGNVDAKIIVLEYSDTECPFCKVFHSTMQKVIDNSDNNVAWVYRHFPIDSLHKKAFKEAIATECAGDQGGEEAFWEYINRVFEITPSNDGLEVEELSNIAQYVGLDTTIFETCLESGKFKAKIEADMAAGAKDGANGTPFSLIIKDGKVVDTINGAEPYETVVKKLNAANR